MFNGAALVRAAAGIVPLDLAVKPTDFTTLRLARLTDNSCLGGGYVGTDE